MPRNVMSMGLMTAAALIPAKPVPSPAPMPAAKQMKNLNSMVQTSFRISGSGFAAGLLSPRRASSTLMLRWRTAK